MACRSLFVVALLVATTESAVILSENGTVIDVADSKAPSSPPAAYTVGGPTIEDCFVSACQSASVRNSLIQACKKMGYTDCDGIWYHDTYYMDPDSHPTFGVTTQFSYDTSHVNVQYSRANAYYTEWNNKLSTPQQETLKHQVGKETTQSFTNSRAESFSSSIAVEVSAGLPDILQEKITTTFSTSIKTSSSATQSASTSQTWEIDETINVPANTCAKACIFETDGALTLPYQYTGEMESVYVDPKYHLKFAAQCCYLRVPNSQCAVLGGSPTPSGWNYFVSPGAAVGPGGSQCSTFQSHGDTASFSGSGMFTGGAGFNTSTATVTCAEQCHL